MSVRHSLEQPVINIGFFQDRQFMVSMISLVEKPTILLDKQNNVLDKLVSVAESTNQTLTGLTGMVENANKPIIVFKNVTGSIFKRHVHETVTIDKSMKSIVSCSNMIHRRNLT